MANRIETRPHQRGNAVNQSVLLRKVMEVLAVKGFANASITDLTNATGVTYSNLQKAFGTRDDILRAAIRSCAETESSLAHEPLRVSATGKEAILSMLQENLRLRRHWLRHCGCLFTFNAFIIPPEDADLHDFLTKRRRALYKDIRLRLTQSVTKGELPQDANCEALANLCLTLLSGLMCRIQDGTPLHLLFRSIELFVNTLGFTRRRRRTKHRMARASRHRRERNP